MVPMKSILAALIMVLLPAFGGAAAEERSKEAALRDLLIATETEALATQVVQ